MKNISRRGFSLIELFVTLGLIAVAGPIAIRLMHWSISTTSAARLQAATSLRFDGATTQLRTDIWAASSLRVVSKKELDLQQPNGEQIVWKIGPNDRLTRNDKPWEALGVTADTTFIADESAVRFVIPTRPDGSQKSITFPSAMAMLAGGKR